MSYKLDQTGQEIQKDLNLVESLASDFSTSSTYVVGALVRHEGAIYKCKTAISTAGDWDPTKWDQITLESILGAGFGLSIVNNTISLLIDAIYPVGSIYTTINSTTNPGTLFGGTWIALNNGNPLYLVKSATSQVYTGNDNALKVPVDAMSFRNNYNNTKPTSNRTLGLSSGGGDLIDQGNGNASNTGYYPSNLYVDAKIDIALYAWKRTA